MKKGKIIWLNGTSCAGKSTLAKTLQDRLPTPFYLLSIDNFFLIGPEKFIKSDPNQTVSTALTGFHHTIKTFSDIGIDIIVDHVFLKDDAMDYTITHLDTMNECITLHHDHDVLFVLVTCPLDELRRRENERGNQRIGNAEESLKKLCPKDTYDIIVDTFNNTKEECADKIINLLNYPDKFLAFKTLWQQRL